MLPWSTLKSLLYVDSHSGSDAHPALDGVLSLLWLHSFGRIQAPCSCLRGVRQFLLSVSGGRTLEEAFYIHLNQKSKHFLSLSHVFSLSISPFSLHFSPSSSFFLALSLFCHPCLGGWQTDGLMLSAEHLQLWGPNHSPQTAQRSHPGSPSPPLPLSPLIRRNISDGTYFMYEMHPTTSSQALGLFK